VDRTGAIGLIAVQALEKMRGGSRLTFVCGSRALRALRTYRDAVAGSVRALSVLPAELPAAIERLQNESKELRKQLKGLQEKLAADQGVRLAAAAPEIEGVRVVVEALEGWDVSALKAIASAAIASARACVVLTCPEPSRGVTSAQPVSVVVACSPGVQVDANVVLQQLTHRFGGRGGGKPGMAQGGDLTAAAQEVASAAWTLIEATLSL
jgi:alanyl-tRNA synthetase